MFNFEHLDSRFNVVTEQELEGLTLLSDTMKADMLTADVLGHKLFITSLVTRKALFDYVSAYLGWYSFDYALPRILVDAYREEHGTELQGVWVYHAANDWDGSFFSLDQATAILWRSITGAILSGACKFETIADYKARKKAEFDRKRLQAA